MPSHPASGTPGAPSTGDVPDNAPTAPARYYWDDRVTPHGAWRTDPKTRLPMEPPGQDLAAMRSGLGRDAGTVPVLWPFYVTWSDEQVSIDLEAEHAALSLFGLHQQGQRQPMHRPGISAGAALRALRASGRFSEEAVDRRVAAAANATSVPALLYRLRALVTQLRTVGQPLDYTLLLRNIKDWHHSEARQRVRRAWGLAYHSWGPTPGKGQAKTP